MWKTDVLAVSLGFGHAPVDFKETSADYTHSGSRHRLPVCPERGVSSVSYGAPASAPASAKFGFGPQRYSGKRQVFISRFGHIQ